MFGRFEMQDIGYLLYRNPCPSQHFLCPVYLEVDEILRRRLAGIFLEKSPEPGIADVQMPCHFRHRDILLHGILQKCLGPVYECARIVAMPEHTVAAGHEHQSEKMIYDSGKKLLDLKLKMLEDVNRQ